MSRWTDETLARHVAEFLDRSLPFDQWAPHHSHVATTVWHLRRYPAAETRDRMRAAIRGFNELHGVLDRYHETVTRFYVEVIAGFVARLDRGQGDAELANEVIAAMGTSREDRLRLWGRYYSDPEAVIASERARTSWVPPDLAPLDDEG